MSQRLIYVMDPMCSWCWGFAPVIDAIQAAFPQLDLHLVPGGLRPGVTDPMQDSTRLALAEHWQAVHAATGQPVLTPDDLPAAFVYNTEPACRALVVGRELDAGKIQQAGLAAALGADQQVPGQLTAPAFAAPAVETGAA